MRSKKLQLSIALLLLGTVYFFALTSNNNITFNTDVADDMVDIREMIVLQKPRLIANIAGGVDGLFYGPGWYYLMTIPFLITQGNPYGITILQIILWAVGGYFLLKLVNRWGTKAIIVAGSLWLASHYITTSIRVALNPNPVVYLLPLFIYLLHRYITSGRLKYSVGSFLLGGFFYNCEIAFGVFSFLIIFFSTFFLNKNLLRKKEFWIGGIFFLPWFIPQLIFDLRHNFLLTNAVIKHLTEDSNDLKPELVMKISGVLMIYLMAFKAGLMNSNLLTIIVIPATIVIFVKKVLQKFDKEDNLIKICYIVVLSPLVCQIFLPSRMMLWHTVGLVAVIPILSAHLISIFNKRGGFFAFGSIIITALIVIRSLLSLYDNFLYIPQMRGDPAHLQNELSAIDYVYTKAQGKNFRVYTYLPSVYDYPYQYLFWWYGLRKYGYLPKDYAYLPDRPEYIRGKDKLNTGANPPDSGLIFLIKEPDNNWTRPGWEGTFINNEVISKEMVGPLEIEVRREL